MNTDNDTPPFLRKLLAISTQYLGVQQSATDILVILYLERYKNEAALSIKDIMNKSGLSLSSVSVLCSRLEAEGILNRRADVSSEGRGRKRILYEFSISINDLLKIGLRKYMQEVERVYRDIKLYQKQNDDADTTFNEMVARLESEVVFFYSESSQLTPKNGETWSRIVPKSDINPKENVIETTH